MQYLKKDKSLYIYVDICSERCPDCYRSLLNLSDFTKFSFDNGKIYDIMLKQVEEINFFGGEFLKYQNAFDILLEIRKKNISLKTNGFSPRRLKETYAHNILNQINFFINEPITNNCILKSGFFLSTKDNVDYFILLNSYNKAKIREYETLFDNTIECVIKKKGVENIEKGIICL